MGNYTYTTQKQLRHAFREQHPNLNFNKVRDRGTHSQDYDCDTRCTFVDWLDHLERDGQISSKLAERATL